MHEQRPPLTSALTGAELRRWYWLRSELLTLARQLRVPTSGSKIDLTHRLAAVLDGQEPPPQPARPPTATPLSGSLSGSTVLPQHQRATQQLRSWFVGELGPGFRFDAHMRSFIAEGGHTLDEAVAHWHETRSAKPLEIGAQFELNCFARAWHRDNPGSSHAEMLAAWRTHRAKPRE